MISEKATLRKHGKEIVPEAPLSISQNQEDTSHLSEWSTHSEWLRAKGRRRMRRKVKTRKAEGGIAYREYLETEKYRKGFV